VHFSSIPSKKGPAMWAGSAAWIGPRIKAAALISNRRQKRDQHNEPISFAV
jgi:hypothetical protein